MYARQANRQVSLRLLAGHNAESENKVTDKPIVEPSVSEPSRRCESTFGLSRCAKNAGHEGWHSSEARQWLWNGDVSEATHAEPVIAGRAPDESMPKELESSKERPVIAPQPTPPTHGCGTEVVLDQPLDGHSRANCPVPSLEVQRLKAEPPYRVFADIRDGDSIEEAREILKQHLADKGFSVITERNSFRLELDKHGFLASMEPLPCNATRITLEGSNIPMSDCNHAQTSKDAEGKCWARIVRNGKPQFCCGEVAPQPTPEPPGGDVFDQIADKFFADMKVDILPGGKKWVHGVHPLSLAGEMRRAGVMSCGHANHQGHRRRRASVRRARKLPRGTQRCIWSPTLVTSRLRKPPPKSGPEPNRSLPV